ncbi:MAG: DUF349 domain-containing protein [Paludibacteraceae bacterium]|nr:DUF349 domain-containing protein [Paludibacteraceae bacterium]
MSAERQQLVDELKALLEQDVTAIKDQVEHIKTQFYRAEVEPSTKDECTNDDSGTNEEEVQGIKAEEQPDEQEEQFKALLAEYKAKRAEIAAKAAAELQANYQRKQQLLEEMKTLAEGETDAVMSALPRMRELQAEWKGIGAVPAEKVQEVRKAYQQYQEQFYDMVKINIELRDLDFKKNLELKTLLCEAAERLQENENVIEANRALQQLHEEWAEIGPVARELREELWERFKAASTVINKKHQTYFDELHAKEQANLEKKQAIVEQLREINAPVVNNEPLSSKQWDELTEKIQALQNEWRTIGFAPKKYNQSVYEEYRAECDRFFHAKTAHFKEVRDTFNDNLKRKRALAEEAKTIAEQAKSDAAIQWNETADKVRALQAEWKTIGPVARKYSDDLWKQFTSACDEFFNAKREAQKAERAGREERRNNAKAQFSKRIENLNDNQKLYRLRDNLQQEIKTAENNILFFTAKSKGANKLVDNMQRKIDELKAQLAEVKEKIKVSEEE